jgi:hypothetical protein
VGVCVGFPEVMPLDAMLPEFSVALLQSVFAEVGQSEAPVAVGCSASNVTAYVHELELSWKTGNPGTTNKIVRNTGQHELQRSDSKLPRIF